jgi:hypothetical protein
MTGNTTLKNAMKYEHPSIRPASNISSGEIFHELGHQERTEAVGYEGGANQSLVGINPMQLVYVNK